MRLAEETKLRNQMSAKKAKVEAERKHQVKLSYFRKHINLFFYNALNFFTLIEGIN